MFSTTVHFKGIFISYGYLLNCIHTEKRKTRRKRVTRSRAQS